MSKLHEVVLCILVVLASPTAAIGAPHRQAPPEGWGGAELKIAAAYWGVSVPPLCSSLAVEFDTPLPAGMGGLATRPAEPGTACHMQSAPGRLAGGLSWPVSYRHL